MAKKKIATQVEKGRVYISASFNNTLVTVTDAAGATLAWGSTGMSGFKGTRKSTPYAATVAVEAALKDVKEKFGVKDVEVYIKGPGPGRDASLRAIRASGIKISQIADVTPIPHNGPRPKKKRRA
ncbi:30S ribosomal protein S11 [Candidatus Woesebacteria bacterium GWB1_43_5]|uniref:Small ribosomal subunit protein uS11 n=1 Tax=Candidatus Woesebacteria bacterium GWB1_43_5 TaxID=1802474 RepID=A0A1F7WV75_9BACT|nr:MAG: 30S ribosomal protein S11 [Candidatus Woesebacteria bacterium GWB1_43_5]